MKCPACNFGTMEEIVEGVLHCPGCNHLLKEKGIIDDGMEDLLGARGRVHPRPRRRVGYNWDECQNKKPIYGEGTFNEIPIDSNPDQRNFNESPSPDISGRKNRSSTRSVELINGNYKRNFKEKGISMRQKKDDTNNFQKFNTRKSINYGEYLKVVNERDDLIVAITPDQFKAVMEKNNLLPQGIRLRRSRVKLPWKCKAENHEFITSYSKIKNIGQKCPECQKISYKDYLELVNTRSDLIIGMTLDQFRLTMKENKMLPGKERLRPSYVKLLWKCKAKGHTWFVSYHNVKAGTKCPHCSVTASVTYEDYLEAIKTRPDLIVELSEAEFDRVMVDNDRLPQHIRKSPAHVHNLKWKCKAEEHKFRASYSKIKNEGKKCPECRKTLYKNYIELVNARPDLIIDMTPDQFKFVMKENDMLPRGKRLRPSRVPLRWKCKFKKHLWLAPYNNVKRGIGCPFCGEQTKVIGQLSHPMIEYYSLNFLIDLKHCQVKYEKKITQDRKFRPDLLINRNSNFRINIEQLQKILWFPNKIRIVVVDITFGLNIIGILDKCYRHYQSDNRFLLIVMMREQKDCSVEIIQGLIQEADDISKKIHIKVINFKGYLEFLGLQKNLDNFTPLSEAEKEIVEKLRWARKLALDSFESETEFKKLMRASKRHSDLIGRYK